MAGVSADSFAAVYCRLLDESRDRLSSCLAGDAVLDWFGREVCGRENIAHFVLLEVPASTHAFSSVKLSGAGAPPVDPGGGDTSSLALDLSAMSLSSDERAVPATPQDSAPSVRVGAAPAKCLRPCAHLLAMEAVGKLQFFHAERVEGTRHSSMKVFKDAQRWERACRLHVFYSIDVQLGHSFTIHKMVYRESARCRRNLALQFEQL
ncbi:uncharacterized protein LOC134539206 [Bacillus rossius redtenbacheri]|uniref:uncharacterized protein LOC134539206 n=1 Tax=Bacillus rossius redtenbacheri TaxID=93214 RepID=UPI002FDE7E77